MAEPLVHFKEFVALADFFFQTIGIHNYADRRPPLLLRLIFVWTTGTLVFHIAMLLISPVVLRMDIVETSMTISYSCFVLIGLGKMLLIVYKRDKLVALVWDFRLMMPRTREGQITYDIRAYLKRSKRLTIWFSVLYMILIWYYNLFAMLQYLIYERWLGVRHVGQQLSYNVYLPWPWRDSYMYYVTYLIQILTGYASAAAQISGDLLLCSLTTLVVMHFDYLAKRLREMQADQGRRQNLGELSYLIAYHVKILNFTERLNSIFGAALFLNFLISSCGICFIGFQMTMGVSEDILFKLAMYMFCSLCQVYLICYHSQQLIDASSSVSYACFEQNWYDGNADYQRMLAMVMQRSQKPTHLTATVFVNISRGTMTDILQVSYKFFALLRTMYAE